MKREIIIIGTIHGGWTPNEELQEVLEKYNPNQVLVEIVQEDIEKNKLKNYPPEMIFTLSWAKENKIKVSGFDSDLDVLKKGMTEEDNKKLIKRDDKILKNFTWRDMNKEENIALLCDSFFWNIVDKNKFEKRQFEMLANIKKAMLKSGTIVIVTGAGHLKFFEKHLKGAEFPLRNYKSLT